MRIDYPSNYTEKIGAVSIHALQKIYEIDSGMASQVLNNDDYDHTHNLNNKNLKHNKKQQDRQQQNHYNGDKLYNDNHNLTISSSSTRAFGYQELSDIFKQMAIVIPVKNEKLSVLEGVLSGIPNECLIIIVSNSERTSNVDRYSMEVEMVKQYARFTDKKIMVIHQKDEELGKIFKKVNYNSILDSKRKSVRNGKAEGMIIGILLAKMQSKGYVGFIDSDNYFPGAVNEYVKIFATGFAMSKTPYSNVRILWRSKPKIVDNKIRFPRWGRISQASNKYLNALISSITGSQNDIIATGNAGEHALSMPLAENLSYSSGYSVEPYEFINILEKYGGLLPPSTSPSTSSTASSSPDSLSQSHTPQVSLKSLVSLSSTTNTTTSKSTDAEIMKKGVEIFQIESRDPHLHEEKGDEHLADMMEDSLIAINNSKICNIDLTKQLKNHLYTLQVKQNSNSNSSIINGSSKVKDYYQSKKHKIMDPIKEIPIDKFATLLLKINIAYQNFI
jgi:mannosyl-3-phosphoglycerate synthase